MLTKGYFTISVDHESGWGYADHELSEDDKKRIEGEIFIIRRLLALLEEYKIPVTWAIVGHLIDRGCPFEGETPHPEYTRPVHAGEKRDWFAQHPPHHAYDDPLWFDTANLISLVRQSPIDHDVGSHSYAHILYDEDVTSEESIKADLKNLGRVHRVHDVPLTSFVFPRNVEGYHRLLKINGFTTYRGNRPKWYDKYTGAKKRLAHLIEYFLPHGRTSEVDTKTFGLVNIPDSMLLIGRNGLRRLIPPSNMVRKAKNGLEKAGKEKEVFHLWFHPSNFSYDTESQFEIFEEILKHASHMRDEGEISIATMEDVANDVLEVQARATA